MKIRKAFLLSALLSLAATTFGQGDPAVNARIIEIGKNQNQVMDHLTYLCKKIGPRLTGSPQLQRANEWTAAKFREFGLQNVELEKWGEVPVGFTRGTRASARMITPYVTAFEFTSSAWTPGTRGPLRGRAMYQPATIEDFEKVRAQLKGAWVIRGLRARGAQPTEAENATDAAGIAGVVTGSRDELVITSGRFTGLTWDNLPSVRRVFIRKSDMDVVTVNLDRGNEVTLEFDYDNRFLQGPVPQYNVIAEIPGTEKPDEVIIVSGHLDSWDGPGSEGACDNGTGTMVALETARILMKAGAKPKRTIRFIMWTGEEQGLLGSRAYVEMHRAELSKISAVFVDDGGTNYQGGLDCVESMAAMLRKAQEPMNGVFPDLPFTMNVQQNMPRGGGSDHAPFNAAGVPGFFWDEVGRADYRFIHHTQHDSLQHAIPEYLVQSSVNSAIMAYNLACADTLLPRAPVAPSGGGGR